MRILVSNDDGIHSEGIFQLVSSLMSLGKVVVVAPDMERSATGHSITMHHPLRVNKVLFHSLDIEAYSVDGTPADCVKIGIDILMPEKPDLVFTGINRGANLGTDVLYSGTVSAAAEGSLLGITSVAFSLISGKEYDYTYAGEIAYGIARQLIEAPLQIGTLLNVNIPNIPQSSIKGIMITQLGSRKYSKNYVKRQDPRGNTYYWLAGEVIDDLTSEQTDVRAIHDNYVSITPLQIDLTHYKMIKELIHLCKI